jgi:hypothetical protein
LCREWIVVAWIAFVLSGRRSAVLAGQEPAEEIRTRGEPDGGTELEAPLASGVQLLTAVSLE